ncbi:MAG: helix-turn-helix domain-containing protein [Solirubrobacterales bacterium]|nr:helix-turn-helix domain-containing protein [Solirubrobacterales bacterium]
MSATSPSSDEDQPDLGALAKAVAEGAGLPAVARAAARALDLSLAIVDRSSAVLAIAAHSPDEEDRLRSRGSGVKRHRLRVAGQPVGELRLRTPGSTTVDPGLLELVAVLIGLELERTRSGDWADEDEMTGFVDAVLARDLTSPDEIANRATGLGVDLDEGGGAVIARLGSTGDDPTPEPADRNRRALTAGLRALRGGGRGALVALAEDGSRSEIRAIVTAVDSEQIEKAARALETELDGAVGAETGNLTVGYSRHVERPDDLFRAGKEALLAVNVAEAEGTARLAFEATGSYRLLLSAMSENPAELEWFYDDTVAPLAAYDEQYGSDLVGTVETFLKNDGNIAPTAEELFTHRHTIRYRLGRVRDLCGHDLQTTDGRERLGFGLKAMRALGLGPRSG